MVATMLLVIAGALIGLIPVFIAFIIFYKPPLARIDVLEERDNRGLVIFVNNGKITLVKRGDNIEAFKINGTRIPLFKPIPKSFFHHLHNKKGDKLYAFRDKEGFLHPIGFDFNENENILKLKPYYRDMIDWIVQETEERQKIKERVQGWLQYAPMAGMILAFMALVLSIVFVPQFVQKTVSQAYTVKDDVEASGNRILSEIDSRGQVIDAQTLVKAAQIIQQYNLQQQVVNGNYTVNNIPVNTSQPLS